MAEAESLSSKINDAITDVYKDTFGKSNLTSQTVGTALEQKIAYTFIVLMAVIPIYIGSWKSITKNKKDQDEIISTNDAMAFPFIASGTLFGIFLFFKILSQENIDLLISFYFLVLGTIAMNRVFGPCLSKLYIYFSNPTYSLSLKQVDDKTSQEIVTYDFDNKFIFSFILCGMVSVWYFFTKHWVANNLIGLAFAVGGIELLKLSGTKTGAILLIGLFFYDIFWVFGTNVMVTVAKKFNAPIKVVFPQDFLQSGFYSTNHSMLGLGDIVIPGIFISLLLRFDLTLSSTRRLYFNSGFIAYFLGLVLTIVVMVVFEHPQPALLYLVPSCLGIPFMVAYFNGQLKEFINYSEEDSSEEVKDSLQGVEDVKKDD